MQNINLNTNFSNTKPPLIPENLKQLLQFVVWKLIQKTGEPKPSKIPFNPKTGAIASPTDPTTWGSYDDAREALNTGNYSGMGFVFTESDSFVFLDLDDCAENGQWMAHAKNCCSELSGAALETSQSGCGLHAVMMVSSKDMFTNHCNKWKDSEGNKFEFYTQGRFVAFGKDGFNLPEISTLNKGQENWLANFIPTKNSSDDSPIDWTEDIPDPSEDRTVIRKAEWLDKENLPYHLFGRFPPNDVKPQFIALWNSDPRLVQLYPDTKRPFDHSSAEMALASKLAYLTKGNPAWVERIMSVAPLCQRDKWKNRKNYRKRTIEKAINSYYQEQRRWRIEEDKRIGNDAEFSVMPQILTLSCALQRLVLIQSGSSVVDRETKSVLSLAEAEKVFAASKYSGNGKDVPVIKAWLSHPDRKSVDVLTWMPGDAEFCNAPERTQAGSRAFNLWAELPILHAPDNWHERAQPFFDHMEYLIPNKDERERFLQWVAHIFQRPWELPHTHYLMIATVTGTGRGTLGSILTRSLRGYVAANMDTAALWGNFNGRLSQKYLATVDEIREGLSHDRYAKQEALKSKLTEELRMINPKYGHQSIEKNCTRWLMFSNHSDALPFDNSDRRIIVIDNPSIRRSPHEYKVLNNLIKSPEFIASIQQYFMTFDILDFDPFAPAPMNAAKQKALQSLESDVDKAIRQFAEDWPGNFATRDDLKGFIGEDGLSDTALRHAIRRAGMKTGQRLKVGGKTETILIVSKTFSPDDVISIDNAMLAEKVLKARQEFTSSFK